MLVLVIFQCDDNSTKRKKINNNINESVKSEFSLLFVYNANSGLFNSLTDYVHKIVSPETYSCNLCKITYGNFGKKKKWSNFINNLNEDVSFTYRELFIKDYPEMISAKLPAVFKVIGHEINIILSEIEINKCTNIDELIALVEKKIKSVH